MQEQPGILYEQLNAVVSGMGYTLVDAQGANVKGTFKVHCIIFKPEGISTGDCEAVSRALDPRLELLYSNQDVRLEVSSPGLERKFATLMEFQVFKGRLAKVLARDADWVEGIIDSVESESVGLKTKTGTVEMVKMNDILKAQLVYQEVR